MSAELSDDEEKIDFARPPPPPKKDGRANNKGVRGKRKKYWRPGMKKRAPEEEEEEDTQFKTLDSDEEQSVTTIQVDSITNLKQDYERWKHRIKQREEVRFQCLGYTTQTRGHQLVDQCERITYYGSYCPEHAHSELGLAVKQSAFDKKGLGLWTTILRKKGDFLCQYAPGAPISKSVPNTFSGYVQLTTDPALHVDAWDPNSGYGRFINDGDYQPNDSYLEESVCNVTLFYSERVGLYFRANRDIPAQTELTYRYGQEYWNQETLYAEQIKEMQNTDT
jgi:hypothetical protein